MNGQLYETRDHTDIFRPDAIAAQAHRVDGEVILKQSLPSRIITVGIVLIVTFAMVGVLMGHYSRTETARGVLVPVDGYAKVQALRAGVVTAFMVKDGDHVRAGQRLVVIKMESPNGVGAVISQKEIGSISHQTLLASRQVDLASRRSKSEVARLHGIIDGMREQASTLDDQLRLQQKIVLSMSQTFKQVRPVVDKGYISKIDYERRLQELLAAQEALSRLRQQRGAIGSDITRTENEQDEAIIAGQNDVANAQLAIETLQQQRIKAESEGSYSINAPVAGRVTAIQTGVGRVVTVSVPLLIIVPENGPLRVDLFVPSRSIGFVKHGQEVRLLYDAYPYQRFGSFVGHIDAVSKFAVAGQETDAPFEIKEPVYKVTATLEKQQFKAYGKHVTPQAGMTLAASLILERQSFLDWILDPLRAVSDRN